VSAERLEPLRSPVVLAALNGLALALLIAHVAGHGDQGLAVALACAALFAVSEATAVQLEIGGARIALAFRATPLLVGLAFAAPAQVVGAAVIGMSAGHVVGRRIAAAAAAPIVAGGVLGTAAAAFVFDRLLDARGGDLLSWWLAASAAAAVLAISCALAAWLGLPRGSAGASLTWRAAAATALAALVDASLGMTVVIFLRTEPAALWLLVGPAAVARRSCCRSTARQYRSWRSRSVPSSRAGSRCAAA
jgi:hypothetical protein